MERFCCDLHALQAYIDSIGLPTMHVSIVFCMLWSHARVQFDSISLPSLHVSVVFYMPWRHARVQLDCIRLPTLDVSMRFVWFGSMSGYRLTPLDCPH